jgi:hypothetical protein
MYQVRSTRYKVRRFFACTSYLVFGTSFLNSAPVLRKSYLVPRTFLRFVPGFKCTCMFLEINKNTTAKITNKLNAEFLTLHLQTLAQIDQHRSCKENNFRKV